MQVGRVIALGFVLAVACGKDETPPVSSWGAENQGGRIGTGGDTSGGSAGETSGGSAGETSGGSVGSGGADGGASSCVTPTANPSEVKVGEFAALDLPNDVVVPYVFGATESLIANFYRDGQGRWKVLCRAAGTIEIQMSTECPEHTLSLTCIDDRGCCPIDVPDEFSDCSEFGGSPPCYTACRCVENDAIEEFIAEDENGCLMRSLVRRDNGESVACTLPDGEKESDPRPQVSNLTGCEARSLQEDLPFGSCRGLAEAFEVAGPVPLGAGGAASEEPSAGAGAGGGGEGGTAGGEPERCESEGLWRVDFPVACYPRQSCNYSLAPVHGLELEAPTQLIPSASGCDLTFIEEAPWSEGFECGNTGYRLDLHVEGDTAVGFIRSAETGSCNGESTTVARAVRVR